MAEGHGSEARHVRYLFFEAVFATKLFQDGVDSIKNRWQAAAAEMTKASEQSKQAFTTAMEQATKAADDSYKARVAAAWAAKEEVKAAAMAETEAIDAELAKQVALAEAAAKARVNAANLAGEQASFLEGGQGVLPGMGADAEINAAMLAKDQEVRLAQEAAEGRKLAAADAAQAAARAYAVEVEAAGAAKDAEIKNAFEVASSRQSTLGQYASAAKAAGNATMGLLTAVGMGVGVFAGLYMAIDHIVTKYVDWAAETARLSSATGVGTDEIQALVLVGERFGVTAEKMETWLTRFSRAVVTNTAAFRAMGIDTHSTTSALEGLMDVLKRTTDDSEKLRIVTSLLPGTSRNAVGNIVAALSEGDEAFKKQIELGKQYGIILDKNAITAGLFGKAIHDGLTLQFKGLENQLAVGMMPEVEAIWVLISSSIQQSKGAIAAIGSTIASVMGAIIGFVTGLFGIQIDWNKAIKDTTTLLQQQAEDQKNQQALQDAANKIQETTKQQVKDLTEANKDLNRTASEDAKARNEQLRQITETINKQTKAIDDQIKVLQDNKQNFDQLADDRVKQLENEKTNLEDQLKLEDDLHQSLLAQLQDQLDLAKDVDERKMRSNETLVDYQRRLYELNLQDQIKTESGKRKTTTDTLQQQIDQLRQATDEAKENYAKQTDAQIDALNRQKDSLNSYLKNKTDAINLANQREQDATARMVDANEAKIEQLQQTTENAASSSAGAFVIDYKTMSTQVQAILQNMQNSATGTANTIGGALHNMFLGQQLTPAQQKALDDFGNRVGSAIWGGIKAGLEGGAKSGAGWLGSLLSGGVSPGDFGVGVHTGVGPVDTVMGWLGLGHAEGGVFSTPHFAKFAEDGPEAVIPLTKPQKAQEVLSQIGVGVGGGTVVNFNGPVADALVGARVADRIAQGAKRKQLLYGAGL